MSFEDLYGHLLSHELGLEQQYHSLLIEPPQDKGNLKQDNDNSNPTNLG
jgi:hypothetical protein